MLTGKSLKAQLLLLCTGLSLITLLVGALGYVGLGKVSNNYNQVAETVLPQTKNIGEFMIEFLRVRVRLRTLGIPGLSKEQADLAVAEAKKYMEAGDVADRAFSSRPFAEGEKAVYERFHGEWQAYKDIGRRVLALHEKHTPEAQEEMRQIFLKECPEAANMMNAAVDDAIRYEADQEKKLVEAADSASNFASTSSQVVSLAGVLVAMLVGYFFATSLSRRISTVTEELTRNAEDVGAASQQIATASHDLSKAATTQAAYLQQSVSAVEEVSAMVAKNAENAKQSQVVSTTSHEAAGRGKQAVDGMIQSIEDINQSNTNIMRQIEASNREISDIVKVIADIGSKTKVINDIVFQTKLLSFNASVEAARAGEHGKGFAVVAEEVGNLAQMSGNAAKEISGMLESSIQKVETIVNDTKAKVEALVTAGRQRVEAGTLTAKRCGEVLDEVVSNVREVNQRVSEIATASQEQAQGIIEITKSMDNLDKVTQQNAAASEDSAAYAQQLRGQAGNLHSVVRELVSTVHGRDSRMVDMSSSRHEPEERHYRAPMVAPRNVVAMNGRRDRVMNPGTSTQARRSAGDASLKKAVGAPDPEVPGAEDSRFGEG